MRAPLLLLTVFAAALTGMAHGQMKLSPKAAPGANDVRYFTAIDGLMDGNADVILKETRQGKTLTAATLFPDLTTRTYEMGFCVGAGIGLAGGGLIALSRRRADRRLVEQAAADLGGLDPDQITELDDAATGTLTRDERTALIAQDRATWRTPALATLDRPALSPLRKAGLLTLRGYLVAAAALVVVKIVQAAGAG